MRIYLYGLSLGSILLATLILRMKLVFRQHAHDIYTFQSTHNSTTANISHYNLAALQIKQVK